MDEETATPEAAPVESPSVPDALAAFLAEDDTPQEAKPDDTGQSSTEEPATEGEAQEADDGNSEEQPPEQQPTFKVKVRGEEVEVPLNELLNGYSRTEDYKAKTAEVAEQRRQLATEYADKLEQQVQQFVALDPILSLTKDWTPENWNQLAAEDPTAYVQFKAQHDARVQAFQQAQQQIASARQEQTAKQNEALQSYYAQQREALLAARPEFSDQSKLQSFAVGVADYLKGLGFAPDEITATNDHRALLIADKARMWDELQKAKATAQTKQAPPKQQPTLKPRATEQTPRAPTKRPPPNASDAEKQAWIMARLDAE